MRGVADIGSVNSARFAMRNDGRRQSTRRPFGFPQLLLLLLAFVLLSSVNSAHDDPIGDLYPLVKVENGNFAIYFYNDAQEQKRDDYNVSGNFPLYRMVYSTTGELLGPRTACKEINSEDISAATSMVFDKKFKVGNETLFFDAELLKNGKPSYFVEKEGTTEHRRLPWPEEVRINCVASAAADEQSVAFSATTHARVLTLFHFERGNFKAFPDDEPETRATFRKDLLAQLEVSIVMLGAAGIDSS